MNLILPARIHYQGVYYRPSFQGGDTVRPLCRTGCGFTETPKGLMTSDETKVTCPACKSKLALARLTPAPDRADSLAP